MNPGDLSTATLRGASVPEGVRGVDHEVAVPLEVAVHRSAVATTIRLRGELDLSTAGQLSTALELVDAAGSADVELDLIEVGFIGCRGLDDLVRAGRRAAEAGTELRIRPGTALVDLTELLGEPLEAFGGAVVVLDGPPEPAAPVTADVVVAGRRDGVLLLSPRGALDADAAGFLRDVLDGALTIAGHAVVVDLHGVDRLEPDGLLAFLRAHRHARDLAVGLGFARPPLAVREALAVETARALVTGDSVDEVHAALAGGLRRGKRSGGRRHDEYAHLTPLFAELRRLPPNDRRHGGVRSRLITGFLPVARNIARRHAYRGENLDDLEQVAVLGLINAVDRFDAERGTDFLSFAVPTINGEVQRHYRDRTSAIRVPRPLHEVQVQVGQLVDEMSQRLGRAPTPRQLAERLDLPVDTVVEALQAAYETRPRSLDEPHLDDDSSAPESTRFASALGTRDRDLDLVEYRESLSPLLDQLASREREIVLLRFYGNMSQSEIARRVGISQMHVSRLLAATLAKLRRTIGPEA